MVLHAEESRLSITDRSSTFLLSHSHHSHSHSHSHSH